MDMHTASSAALLVGDGKDRQPPNHTDAKGILGSFIPGNNLRSDTSRDLILCPMKMRWIASSGHHGSFQLGDSTTRLLSCSDKGNRIPKDGIMDSSFH
jgi:hypothetical protein